MTDTPSLPPVFHDALPIAAWMDEKTRRLPGIQPLAPGDWLRVDEAFAGQMALRDRLITTRRDEVLALEEDAGRVWREVLVERGLEAEGARRGQEGRQHSQRPPIEP